SCRVATIDLTCTAGGVYSGHSSELSSSCSGLATASSVGAQPLRGSRASFRIRSGLTMLIGIGGSLAAPPLPHHRAYGSAPRRFDRVKRLTMPPTEDDRSSRRRRWIVPAALSHGELCASTQIPIRRQPPHESGIHAAGAVARTGLARSSTRAKY